MNADLTSTHDPTSLDSALDQLVRAAASNAEGGRFAEAFAGYSAALEAAPGRRELHLRLYELAQVLGRNAEALAHLDHVLATARIITTPARVQPPARTVLAFYRAALWEGNLPLELILDPEHTTLHRLYVDPADPAANDAAAQLIEYDVLFNAIAESDAARPALRAAARFAAACGVPCINPPQSVITMGREAVAARFAGSANVYAPAIERVPRAALAGRPITAPVLVRPIGSQAGVGLAKLDGAADLAAYLRGQSAAEFYVTAFVDYRAADGFYRKYRIMFVRGVAFAYHLAISPNWMIHYYNAPMFEHAWMRAEEERFVDDLDGVFGGRLRDALREIGAAIDLQYFGIDCSIAPDGRLLLFEADSAMLVHGTDPPELFRYKKRAFTNVQRAFSELLR
ncbi:MAG: hypothetical protein NVS3B28_27720 [Candidatus Velthaea sp.]